MSVRSVAVLFAFFLCFRPAVSQTTEAELKSRLVGKPLYLRGYWRDDSLHFDSYGQLIGNAERFPYTLSGVDVIGVRLNADRLVLMGKRVGLEFKGITPKRVTLLVGKKPPFSDELMQITIDAPADGNFSRALDTIFADDLADLAPTLPQYWQRFAREKLLPASSTDSPSAATIATKRIGGGVKPPTIAKSKEPQFSQAARNLRYSGKSLINLWVGEDGKPSHLAVIRPAGLGLDEQALYSVQQYVFKPAMENDKPVLVELNIEVAFNVY
jgi:TonB family protein